MRVLWLHHAIAGHTSHGIPHWPQLGHSRVAMPTPITFRSLDVIGSDVSILDPCGAPSHFALCWRGVTASDFEGI